MPIINFFSDFEKDLKYIQKYFSTFRKICGDYFDVLIKSSYPDCYRKTDKEISEYFKENSKKIIHRNEISGKKLKEEWSKINDEFFKQLVQITKFKLKNKIYYCHISSSYLCGGYKKPNIVIICPLLKEATPTLAHELVHLHFLDILDQLNITLDKKDYWKLSETIVPYIMSKIKIAQVKHKKEIGYSSLSPLYKNLKSLKSKSFKKLVLDYIQVIEKQKV